MTDKEYHRQQLLIEKQNKREQEYERSCDAVLNGHGFVEAESNIEYMLNHFLWTETDENWSLLRSFKRDKKDVSAAAFIFRRDDYFSLGRGQSLTPEKYYFGVITTKRTYPRILIRPETITDKLEELITSVEIDFPEHKKFSAAFYVITDDPAKTKNIFSTNFLNALLSFKSAHFEFYKNKCLFTQAQKPVSPLQAKKFSELAIMLLEHIGGIK